MVRKSGTKLSSDSESNKTTVSVTRKDKRRQEAESRKRSQPLRRKIALVEEKLAIQQLRKDEIEEMLANNEIYQAEDKSILKTLLLEKAEIDNQCELMEMEWLEYNEQLEDCS